jgi:MYXO-CTERM domain-containing protein
MMVIDGRTSSASGMTCGEVRDLAEEMGCWDAVILDGGGSSTMVIDGGVVNDPSDGSQRTLPNHIGVVVQGSADSECELSSGRWCDGDELNTCTGGSWLGPGDCSYFGATCEEDADWAYCVNYQCPDGDGQAQRCIDETQLEGCTDGVYASGNCALFGMVCGEDSQGSACMDSRCEGPDTSTCLDESTVAGCQEGVYSESSCEGKEICVESGESASCRVPDTGGDTGSSTTGGEDSERTDTGSTADGGSDGGSDGGVDTNPPGEDDRAQAGDSEPGCGCASGGRPRLPVLGVFLLGLFRRRRSEDRDERELRGHGHG